MPIISKAPGFVAYYVVEAGVDVVSSMAIRQNQAGAEEYNRMAAGWVRQALASLVPGPPTVTGGEVAVSETA